MPRTSTKAAPARKAVKRTTAKKAAATRKTSKRAPRKVAPAPVPVVAYQPDQSHPTDELSFVDKLILAGVVTALLMVGYIFGRLS